MVQLQIGTWLLANVFSALLPPKEGAARRNRRQQQQQHQNEEDAEDNQQQPQDDVEEEEEEEEDYYVVMGVSPDATQEDIRKAYKKASLKYHPDKVAQRREDPELARVKYEKIQQAYGVLVNEEKRQRYRILGNSPKRYQFVSQGQIQNPGALYENLTSASFVDKTRLVVLCSLIVLIILLQPILICAKVNHVVTESGALEDTSWVVLLIPFWIIDGCIIAFWVGLLFLVPTKSAKMAILLQVVEQMLWYWSIMRLARKWDNSIEARYASVLIPVYLAMSVRWIQSCLLLQKIRTDVRKMVSLDYLEKEVLQGKSLEDLSEEEQEQLRNDYMVITVPDDFQPILEPVDGDDDNEAQQSQPLDEEKMEEQKVESSPEFEAATEIYNTTFGGLVSSLIFGCLFLITLTLKLDDKISASWWTVFVPIWIYWGCQWVYYFYLCACGTIIGGDEILLHVQDPSSSPEGDEQGDEKEEDDGGDKKEESTKTGDGSKKKTDDNDDGEKHEANRLPTQGSSTMFRDPDQSMSVFKKQVSSSSNMNGDEDTINHSEEDVDDGADDDRPDDEKEADRELKKKKSSKKKKKSKKKDKKSNDEKSSSSTNGKDDEEEKDEEKPSERGADDTNNKTTTESKNDENEEDAGDNGDDDDDDDDADNIRVDEETFRAWQNAYEEAERGAMEQQAKSAWECCSLSIKLMLLLLVVAKIQKNYDNDDPDDVGFNTFWILFPFFLFFGVVCCCCTLAIYCAVPGDADDLYGDEDVVGPTSNENDDYNEGDGNVNAKNDVENPPAAEASGNGTQEPPSSADDRETANTKTDSNGPTNNTSDANDCVNMDDLD